SSDAGYMSIQDFANASKKFAIDFDNSIWLQIRPVSREDNAAGEITEETTQVKMNCVYEAGSNVGGELHVLYERTTEDGEFRLSSFSFDDIDDTFEPSVISAFGFTPSEIADEVQSTTGGIASLLELTTMYMLLDMNTKAIQAHGSFNAYQQNGDDKVLLSQQVPITGKSGSFSVLPN
ncbi:MAG: hypothetical protein IKC90_03260, partial [Akkermansia sp.]|nr:hypothetical protein [Akkermansia sp.]